MICNYWPVINIRSVILKTLLLGFFVLALIPVAHATEVTLEPSSSFLTLKRGETRDISLGVHVDSVPSGVSFEFFAPFDLDVEMQDSLFTSSADNTIFVRIQVPYSAAPGDHVIEFKAFTDDNRDETSITIHVPKSIDIQRGFVNFNVEPRTCKDVFPGNTALFDLEFENFEGLGTFDILNEGPEGFVTFVTPSSRITGSSFGQVVSRNISIEVPDDIAGGEYRVALRLVRKDSGKMVASQSLCLNVLQRAIVNMSFSPAGLDVGADSPSFGELFLSNTGDVSLNLVLTTSQEWFVLSQNTIELASGEIKSIDFNVLVPADLPTGSHGVQVFAEGAVERAETLFLNVVQPDVAIEESSTDKASDNVLVISTGFTNTTNKKLVDLRPRIEGLPGDWSFEAEEESFDLEVGESRLINLFVTPGLSPVDELSIIIEDNSGIIGEDKITLGSEFNSPISGLFLAGEGDPKNLLIVILIGALVYAYRVSLKSKAKELHPKVKPKVDSAIKVVKAVIDKRFSN